MSKDIIKTKDNAVFKYSNEEIEIIKKQLAPGCADAELNVLIMRAQAQGMNVFAGDCHFVPQKYKDKNGQWQEKWNIVASIDFQRKRTGKSVKKLEGRDVNPYYITDKGEHRKWINVPNKGYPSYPDYAKAALTVDGVIFEATATWKEYAKFYNGKPQSTWASIPGIMLTKCAESMALRQAYPDELGSIYTKEEMGVEIGKREEPKQVEVEVIQQEPEQIDPPKKQEPKKEPPPPPEQGDSPIEKCKTYRDTINQTETDEDLQTIKEQFTKEENLSESMKERLYYYYYIRLVDISHPEDINKVYDLFTNEEILTPEHIRDLNNRLANKNKG